MKSNNHITQTLKLTILSLAYLLAPALSHAQEWQTDFKTAQSLARGTNHNIVLVFQGSDWCAPCIKMENEIWSTKEFQSYAQGHYVMLKADFPKRKKNALTKEEQDANNLLAEKYNKQGFFPLVVVLNPDGQVLGQTGYNKTDPAGFINILNSF